MRERARRWRHDLGYLTLRSFLTGARLLPLGLLRLAGAATGSLARRLARRDVRRALGHLRESLPGHEESWYAALLRDSARHLGLLLGEIGWLWSASPAALLARTEWEGLDNLTGACRPRLGAILVTAHCGNWEWMNLALGARGLGMSVAAREVFDPRLDRVARHLRGRLGGDTVLRGPEAGGRLVRALRRGRVVGLLIDQDIDAPGAFVDFFGRPAWTPVGAALLALRTGAPLVPGFATRLPNGHMQVRLEPPISHPSAATLDDAAALLTAMSTARIEAQIRQWPAQWVWMHQRWKRQPRPGDRVWGPHGEHPTAQPPPARA